MHLRSISPPPLKPNQSVNKYQYFPTLRLGVRLPDESKLGRIHYWPPTSSQSSCDTTSGSGSSGIAPMLFPQSLQATFVSALSTKMSQNNALSFICFHLPFGNSVSPFPRFLLFYCSFLSVFLSILLQ
jgi:hypothetical protein